MNDFDLAGNKWYYTALVGVFIAFGGLGLILEHLLTFGYLEFEPFGHETYGLITMIAGALLFFFCKKAKPA